MGPNKDGKNRIRNCLSFTDDDPAPYDVWPWGVEGGGGGGGRRQGLRAQTQIVLTSGGGSGRAASSLYYAGHHGRERRIDAHTMGRAWGGVGGDGGGGLLDGWRM